ncbi:hypothetical protein BDY19DRAFT_983268 [Irpex rosettiformis]|uniref:Uncharacterized protein n=1 Tax=Irpex rosettiformis TaxID=378272 RepID=A0ACB8UE78_9APHY|nr:hypothetical protein BDY19DRAFT_983268 [Irpex rosettiformis]
MSNAKSKQANGAGKKTKQSAPSSTGTSTPVTGAPESSSAFELTTYGSGRPDKALYDAEQNKIKADIDAAQAKLTVVKDKLSGGKNGPAAERRKELLDELAQIRSDQGNIKQKRSNIFEEVNNIQETVQQKVKELNASKAKLPYKTAADIENRIAQLHKQVESGNLKLADEKRALAEISQLNRNKRIVEGFQADEDIIQAGRDKIAELKKELDNPEGIAKAERYDTIQAELDEIKKQNDEIHAIRSRLLDERTALQAQLDILYNRKRDSAQNYRAANDRFYAKLSEDRARRAERERAQRAADEEAKKAEIANRLREEAEIPAFQAQIEDCDTLINYFSGKPSGTLSTARAEKEKAHLAGVTDLDIRKVETTQSEGLVIRKKKGEEEDSYFVGGKGKKGKKNHNHGHKAAPAASPDAPATTAEASSSDRLNVPLPTLSALLSLSIPPPTSSVDLPRVIEDLNTKKAWFIANQARVTAENKAKAEKEIARLTGGKHKTDISSTSEELSPPNGEAELPAELAHTPAVTSEVVSVSVPEEVVEEKLEVVKEAEETAAES